jgi:hypothetical protein
MPFVFRVAEVKFGIPVSLFKLYLRVISLMKLDLHLREGTTSSRNPRFDFLLGTLKACTVTFLKDRGLLLIKIRDGKFLIALQKL